MNPNSFIKCIAIHIKMKGIAHLCQKLLLFLLNYNSKWILSIYMGEVFSVMCNTVHPTN